MYVMKSFLASVTVRRKRKTTGELSLVEFDPTRYMVLAENFLIKSYFAAMGRCSGKLMVHNQRPRDIALIWMFLAS